MVNAPFGLAAVPNNVVVANVPDVPVEYNLAFNISVDAAVEPVVLKLKAVTEIGEQVPVTTI